MQLVAVASHLWASDVHRAAIDRLGLREGDHVLDVGAGFGPATIAASDEVGPTGFVTAIEPSRFMRAAIRLRLLVSRNRRRIAVRNAGAEDLPVSDGRVDAVLALNVVHLLDSRTTSAQEIARALKADGRVLFVEEDLEHPDHSFHEQDGHGHFAGLVDGVEAMADALRAAGLSTTQRVEQIGGQPAHVIEATFAFS